jgi:drug/metabolite transporter (DMT)-like permease|tara:strand:+ start:2883 stop:3776 length:894 start_codon:yes stop_codon:yes gene_type:complete
MTTKHPAIAWVLFVILSVIWGSSFILIKKGLIYLGPEEVAALRIASASLVLTPFALSRIKQINKKNVTTLILVGFMGSLLPAFFFALAQTKLTSALTGIMNALTPFFTIIISVLFFSEKPDKRVYFGVMLGFLGTLFLISTRENGQFTFNYYAFFVVAATVLYGINANLIKHYLSLLKSLSIASLSLIMVGPFAIVYLLFLTPFLDHIHEPEVLIASGYIVILGVFGTALALVLFNKIVQLTNAVFSTSVTYLIPIISVFWGFIDGEKLSLLQLISMLTIMVGIFISNSKKVIKKPG